LDALVTAYQFPGNNPVIDSIAVGVFLACVLAAIWALVAQHNTDLGRPFAWFGAGALGYQLILFFAGLLLVFVHSMRQAMTQPHAQPDFLAPSASARVLEITGPWEIAGQSMLALWGLILLLRWRRSKENVWTTLTN